MTFAGRIKIGMAAQGIAGASELARRMKLRRQTVQKWLSGEVSKIEPENLIKLAQILDMDPEWLATREGEPQRKGRVTLEQKRLIELYNALPEQLRRAWMRSGDAMLQDTGEVSKAQPFTIHEPAPTKGER